MLLYYQRKSFGQYSRQRKKLVPDSTGHFRKKKKKRKVRNQNVLEQQWVVNILPTEASKCQPELLIPNEGYNSLWMDSKMEVSQSTLASF